VQGSDICVLVLCVSPAQKKSMYDKYGKEGLKEGFRGGFGGGGE